MAQTVAIRLSRTATPSGCFGTTKLNWRPEYGDYHFACVASYEGGIFFEVTDRKGMAFIQCVWSVIIVPRRF